MRVRILPSRVEANRLSPAPHSLVCRSPCSPALKTEHLPLAWKGWTDQAGFGIETSDLIRAGAFDRATARAFAGELKNVAG
jgi:hypothetical protein